MELACIMNKALSRGKGNGTCQMWDSLDGDSPNETNKFTGRGIAVAQILQGKISPQP